MDDCLLYFAYGSNLDEAQMARRCPDALAVGPATLARYRLVFTGHSRTWDCAVATIVADPAASVRGLLYRCTAGHRDSLDRAEGHPTVYRRAVMPVVTDEGRTVDAFVYVKPVAGKTEGVPSAAYLGLIRRAYLRMGFDASGLPEVR